MQKPEERKLSLGGRQFKGRGHNCGDLAHKGVDCRSKLNKKDGSTSQNRNKQFGGKKRIDGN